MKPEQPHAPPEVEVVDLSKRFGDVQAIDAVSVRFTAGRMHALLGENGAGKSTLVKCLMGYHHADSGRILVDEQARTIANPHDAHALGLGNVRCGRPEDVPAGVRFASIWSNPPIRIGKVALHELLGGWLTRLDDGGRAHLVVSRHLGADSLARWLAGRGYRVERRASHRCYRLLDVALP